MFHSNVRALSTKVEDGASPELVDAMRWLDINVNVNWPLAHYKSAVRYLHKDPVDIAATGGTNWQKYLPPRFQKRIFFPELWSEKELEEWGKGWVEKEVFGRG
jgi:tryptophan 2,3-dioxygenase